jgi:hypothetical protein
MEFSLTPSFTAEMMSVGKTYGITNLSFRGSANDIEYEIGSDARILVSIKSRSASGRLPVRAKDESGNTLAVFKRLENEATSRITISHGTKCAISFD